MKPYFTYLLLCADGTYYCGVTTDLERRVREHNGGKRGARYTRSRQPVRLTYSEICTNRSEAQQREYVIKSLNRKDKQRLSLHWRKG
ncbi:MAG: GIY-YIG nuclease family protein [bacterium]